MPDDIVRIIVHGGDGNKISVINPPSQVESVLVKTFGPQGPAGADGNTILNGSGAPSAGLGVDGDFYIDTDTYDIYGPKAAGAWGSGTPLSGGGGGTWGSITGTLSNQTDLQTELDGKLAAGDIDTFAELDAIVADKSLVNLEDGGTFLSEVGVPHLQFDVNITPTASPVVGLMEWNEDEDTVDLNLRNGVALQVGQEIAPLVKNQTGSTITNGTPVRFAGAIGASGRVLVAPAIADGTIPSSYILGLATQDIGNGEDGHVTWFGKVRGIDTTGTPYGETWSIGDLLYVSPTTAGYLTNVKPSAPDLQIFVGAVVNTHATEGTIFVRTSWRSLITDLDDVDGTPLTTTGQIMVWDNANSYFDFTSNISDFATASHTHVEADITDLQAYLLDVTGEPLSDLSDVTITSIGADEILKWNGSAWINNTLSEAGITATVGTPADNQLAVWTGDGTLEGEANLTYDGTNLTFAGGQILLPSYDVAATPVLALSGDTDTGIDMNTAGPRVGFITGTVTRGIFDNNGLTIRDNGAIGWAASLSMTGQTVQSRIYMDSAGILGQRLDGTAQGFRIYSDLGNPAGNYERLSLSVDVNGDAQIALEQGGTGDTTGRIHVTGDLVTDDLVYIGSVTHRLQSASEQLILRAQDNSGRLKLISAGLTDTRVEFHNASNSDNLRAQIPHAGGFEIYSDLNDPDGNYERLSLGVDTSGNATIAVEAGGTGTAGQLTLSATQVEVPDGTAALPGIVFSAAANTGIVGKSATSFGFTTGGIERVAISNSSLTPLFVRNGVAFGASTVSFDSYIYRDATNSELVIDPLGETLAVRGGTGPWVFRIYSDLDNPAVNYERVQLSMDASGHGTLGLDSGGTGAANQNLIINANGTGTIALGNFEFDVDQAVGAGQDNYVLTYDNGTGLISLEVLPSGVSQLSDLSDVNTSTPTNRNVLVADGVDWESRALVEADISDLQSYLLNITGEPLSDLNDVTITSIGANEILKWSGSAWINNTLAEAGIAADSHTHVAADITDNNLGVTETPTFGGLDLDGDIAWEADVQINRMNEAGHLGLFAANGSEAKFSISNDNSDAQYNQTNYERLEITFDALENDFTIGPAVAGTGSNTIGVRFNSFNGGGMGFNAPANVNLDYLFMAPDGGSLLIAMQSSAGGSGTLQFRRGASNKAAITNDASDNLLISSVSPGDIQLTAGSGDIHLGNFIFDSDQTVGVGQDNYVLTYDNGTGLISLEAASGGGLTNWEENGTTFRPVASGYDIGDGTNPVGNLHLSGSGAIQTAGSNIDLQVAGTNYLRVNTSGVNVINNNSLYVYSDLDDPGTNYERIAIGVDTSGNSTLTQTSGGTGTLGEFQVWRSIEPILRLNGSGGVALGYRCMDLRTNLNDNIAIGNGAMDVSTGTAGAVIAIGGGVLGASTNPGNHVIALGSNAFSAGRFDQSIGIGTQVMDNASASTTKRAVVIGYRAATDLEDTQDLVCIGHEAMAATGGDTTSTVLRAVVIGSGAGNILDDGGDDNTIIGFEAGDTLTTGAFNIAIGSGVNVDSATADNQINIGDRLFHDRTILAERASAASSVAGFGQFWVKDDTPNTPMFTDDAGTDYKLTKPTLSESVFVASPGASEDVYVFFTPVAITVSEMRAVLRGSSTPSVTWTIRHSSDRSAAGNEVVTSGTTTTSTTTGSDVTSFNDATIPADSFIWFETTAQSGTVDEIGVTIVYTED